MKRTIEIEVKPTPEELAAAWWEMDAEEQARFFNALNRTLLPIQLHAVCVSPVLTIPGRCAMQEIGEYANAD